MTSINLMTPTLISSSPSPTYLVFLISTNIMGTLLAVTSSSWLMVWLGLVLNLLSLIPLLTIKKTTSIMEAGTKYFILQSLASTILIMAILLMNYLSWPVTASILTVALMLKLGAAPLHFWVPQVIQHLNWIQILVISTWQKIAPLAIMFTFSDYSQTTPILIFSLASMFVGALGAWTAPSLKHLLAFSSIHHTGWLILLTMSSSQATIFYFLAYAAQMTILMLILNFITSTNKPPFLLTPKNSPAFLQSTTLIFLSMAAMPPFMGFMPKLTALFTFTSQFTPVVLIILILIPALIMTSIYLTLAMTVITSKTANPLKPITAPLDIALAMTLTAILYFPPLFIILF